MLLMLIVVCVYSSINTYQLIERIAAGLFRPGLSPFGRAGCKAERAGRAVHCGGLMSDRRYQRSPLGVRCQGGDRIDAVLCAVLPSEGGGNARYPWKAL